MSELELFTYQQVVRDLAEGVLTVDLKGRVVGINPACCQLLDLDKDCVGQSFAKIFFQREGNDAFIQTILDAVYEDDRPHQALITYQRRDGEKKLLVSTSFIKNQGQKIGVTAVLNDFTELEELRNAVLAMQRINRLNRQLEARNEFIKKTFGRYLSDEIVQELLEHASGLEIGGKKQEAAILFSDLRGFTSLAERMAAQDLIAMLNAYLAEMIEVISAWRGTILEFIGDAIVAVFGAPRPSPAREYDAVACAIEMQRRMPALNTANQARGWPALAMGIGLNGGEVVLGNIGSERKAKYDVIGSNVNLASRIQSCAKGGQVLASGAIVSRLGNAVKVRDSFHQALKGIDQEVEIFEIVALDRQCLPEADGQGGQA